MASDEYQQKSKSPSLGGTGVEMVWKGYIDFINVPAQKKILKLLRKKTYTTPKT